MSTLTEQPNSNNDLVHVRQMPQSDFDALAVKSPTTVYFVNLTGVFTEQSLGEDGDIYLGPKLLTGQPDLTGLMYVNGEAHTLNAYTGTSFVEVFELSQNIADADIIDFFTHISIQHSGNAVVDVECWLETGHYVDEGGVPKYCTDHVVASAQTSIPSSRNSTPIFGNLSFAGTVGGPIESKVVKLCFNASSAISVMRYTATSNVDRASQVLIRAYHSVKR